MKKQILSAFAVVTAISIVVITPTMALADDIKYSQSIYEKIGMDRSEIVSWVNNLIATSGMALSKHHTILNLLGHQ